MIDWNKTELETKFNRRYFELFPNSIKKVYKICDQCGKEGWMPYKNNSKLCGYCSPKKEKKIYEKKKKSFSNPNVTLRMDEYTRNVFGYRTCNLSEKSDKEICRICFDCGKLDYIPYKNYNINKYPNLCKSCIMKKLHREK